ncbi:MAG: DNA mismatch repair endonuclease MutL [Bacteroidales bacterium]|nr:DNA mismatch repair endonuclease MutL [Bacteroidales bacterium]
MSDIIQLLPDSVANQIAAGEVIQRPASVIKELVENAVDAGATSIQVTVKDAGKSLIQVTDNGIGMSETDARLSFERHATSKIKTAGDLFEIRTKGFRGEALASIASIAQVVLKTRQAASELGTQITLSGSVVEKQEPISCATGSNFLVKNLFYNVPARRKFLKSNSTEFKHIFNEFERIVLAHPDIEFSLTHDDQQMIHLPQTNLRQRIIHVFGKQMNQNLTRIENSTSIVSISGFVGKPEFARKTSGEQFFFINQRYMRHPYFHRAVVKAFDNILPADCFPAYFIYFEVDPQSIDVNIHPTKTEIKFENEQAIFQIITAAVKEALGKTNVMPSIDFDTYGVVDIPLLQKDTRISIPEIPVDYSFNPFKTKPVKNQGNPTDRNDFFQNRPSTGHWEKLFENIETTSRAMPNEEPELFAPETDTGQQESTSADYLQFKGRFILTPVKSGLMIIDQRKAHIRILFEQQVRNLAMNQAVSQRLLYPEKTDLNNEDYSVFKQLEENLNCLGFDISDLGSNSVLINGVPESNFNGSPQELLEQIIEEYKQTENTVKGTLKERVALSLSTASAIGYGKILSSIEMQHLVDELFACENPNYSPSGKKILAILNINEIDKLFN